MKRMPFAVALAFLCLGVAHSWDMATTSGNTIDFFTNDTKTHSIVGVQFKNLTASAYNALQDTLLVVDEQADSASVYSFNFTSNEFHAILTRKEIISFAIDPVEEIIFWIEDKSIHAVTLNPSKGNYVNVTIVLRLGDENPRAIAVDSCSGYVYWTSTNSMKPAIEKARYDGSDRKVLIDQDIHEPHRLVIDPQIKMMYWIDIRHSEQYKYRIKYADLEGHNRDELLHGVNMPRALTVSKDVIYFIENQQNSIWKDSKLHILGTLKQVGRSYVEVPASIVAKYTLKEQTVGIQECKALTSLLQQNSANNDSVCVSSKFENLICVHGDMANDTSCTCAPGYIGERCDVSVCQNYCIQGTCSVSDEGEPSCGCEYGYTGARCDINMCFNYCLNNGVCYLTDETEPTCQCIGNYNGSRCEVINKNDTSSPVFSSGDKNITLPKSVDNNFTLGNPVDKNLTVADLLFNRRKITGKVTVNFEIDAN